MSWDSFQFRPCSPLWRHQSVSCASLSRSHFHQRRLSKHPSIRWRTHGPAQRSKGNDCDMSTIRMTSTIMIPLLPVWVGTCSTEQKGGGRVWSPLYEVVWTVTSSLFSLATFKWKSGTVLPSDSLVNYSSFIMARVILIYFLLDGYSIPEATSCKSQTYYYSTSEIWKQQLHAMKFELKARLISNCPSWCLWSSAAAGLFTKHGFGSQVSCIHRCIMHYVASTHLNDMIRVILQYKIQCDNVYIPI